MCEAWFRVVWFDKGYKNRLFLEILFKHAPISLLDDELIKINQSNVSFNRISNHEVDVSTHSLTQSHIRYSLPRYCLVGRERERERESTDTQTQRFHTRG